MHHYGNEDNEGERSGGVGGGTKRNAIRCGVNAEAQCCRDGARGRRGRRAGREVG